MFDLETQFDFIVSLDALQRVFDSSVLGNENDRKWSSIIITHVRFESSVDEVVCFGKKTPRFEQTGGRRRRLFTTVCRCLVRWGADERFLMRVSHKHVLRGMRVFLTSLIQTNANHKTSLNTRPMLLFLSFTKGDDWFGQDAHHEFED